MSGGFDERGLPPGKRLREGLEIGPADLRAMLAGPDRPILIDVREPDEWRICRLDGAVLMPMGEVEERAEEIFDEHSADETTPVVVYCHHGIRSLTAALVLQSKGLRGARSLAGGIDQWSLAIDPGVARY